MAFGSKVAPVGEGFTENGRHRLTPLPSEPGSCTLRSGIEVRRNAFSHPGCTALSGEAAPDRCESGVHTDERSGLSVSTRRILPR